MAENPLNQALAKLNNTISTINNKVEQGKQNVKNYKKTLIQKLQELNEQIKALKNSGNLNIIPQLRQQLQESQSALAKKTDELQRTNTELEEKNRSLQEIQKKIQELTNDIEAKTKEIDQLKQLNGEKDGQISQLTQQIEQLNGQIEQLNNEKTAAQKELSDAQEQINTFIEEIDKINTSLQAEIEKIDQISVELANVDEDEVSSNFEEIRNNITDIMGMINNPEGGPGVASSFPQILTQKIPSFDEFAKLPEDQQNNILSKLILQGNDNDAISAYFDNPNDPTNIGNMKSILKRTSKLSTGGKRHKKHKTMKKRNRKTKKVLKNGHRHILKGGYVYSASKKLDRSSSVITEMSGSRTRSNKKKTRRSG